MPTVAKWDKFRKRLDEPGACRGVKFAELCAYLDHLGFRRRTAGGHFIYFIDGCEGIINLQQQADGKVKGYQVKQARDFLRENGL